MKMCIKNLMTWLI